jgi:thioredoxin-like negative regulator of GroEL
MHLKTIGGITMSENKEKPSREKIVQWYKDEIELATLRAELALLQRNATVSEAERLQAISVIAQITQEPDPEETKQALRKEPDDGC